ncbi:MULTISPECIES: hypothetical protein [unclassified Halobacteriovorax]|uniref:hypothetical protein n=1 Tax=unclassified Halobacteriovorax TaxID=2639665 RepID=UPI00399A4CEA
MIRTYKKKKTHKFFVLLVLFILELSSVSATEYCFNRSRPIHTIRMDLMKYVIDGEKIKIDSHKNCLNLEVKSYRQELFRKLVNKYFPKQLEKSSLSLYTQDMCKFRLKEVTKLKDKVNEQISDIISSEGNRFEIDFGGEHYYATCSKKGSVYLLDLRSKSNKDQLTSLTFNLGKWVDLTSLTKLENKEYSLMVIE